MSILSQYAWTPTLGYPTTHPSTLTSIATTYASQLLASLSNAVASMETGTSVKTADLSEIIRGAQASLSIVSAEQVLATATDSTVKALATEVIYEAMYNLQELADDQNLYRYQLSRGGNFFFLAVYAMLSIFFLYTLIRSRYHWFNVAFFLGYLFELIGFAARALGMNNTSRMMYYIVQSMALTLAPAFIMGGIYFLFAQNVAIYGRQYSVLPPIWYSYSFIACDVLSFLIQGSGGGLESANSGSSLGKWIMVVGILFQMLAMTVFICFWLNFVLRVYFRKRTEVEVNSPYRQKSFVSFIKLFVDTPSAISYKRYQLERFYVPKFAHLRNRRLVRLYPLAVTTAVVFIYIRCIYRVVELYQGFTGYLITHEVYLMTLDALMIAIAGAIFVPFHPLFVFGRENVLTAKDIKGGDGPEAESYTMVDRRAKLDVESMQDFADYPALGRYENEDWSHVVAPTKRPMM